MRIARSVTRLYWMTIFELKGPLHNHCREPSDFFVQTPQKTMQNRPVFCAFHQRNKVTDEPQFRLCARYHYIRQEVILNPVVREAFSGNKNARWTVLSNGLMVILRCLPHVCPQGGLSGWGGFCSPFWGCIAPRGHFWPSILG